ncbi:hypothetical protein [Shinella sp. M27]|uniref:hypothetical protein n=1 Tax=Shinella sp. M27 TaxID=3368614 RepID=UPI003BA12006
MLDPSETPLKVPLSPDDLDVLEGYLCAWCEENGVERTDAAAKNIASALISWYEQDAKSRSRVQLDQTDEPPMSSEIEALLRQIT